MEESVPAYRKRVASLKREVQMLQAERDRYKAEARTATERASLLVTTARQTAEEVTIRIRKESDGVISGLKSKLQAAEERIFALEGANKGVEALELLAESSEQDEVNEDIQSMSKDALIALVIGLRERNHDLQQQIAEVEEERKQRERFIQRKERALDQLGVTVEAHASEASHIASALTQAREELSRMKHVAKTRDSDEGKLRGLLSLAKEEVERESVRAAALEEEADALRSMLEATEADLQRLHDGDRTEESQSNGGELVNELEEENSVLRRQLNAARRHLSGMGVAVESLEDSGDADEIERLKNALASVTKRADELGSLVADMQQREQETRERLKEEKDEMSSMREALDLVNAQSKAQADAFLEVAGDMHSLGGLNADGIDMIQSLQKDLEAERQRAEAAEAALADAWETPRVVSSKDASGTPIHDDLLQLRADRDAAIAERDAALALPDSKLRKALVAATTLARQLDSQVKRYEAERASGAVADDMEHKLQLSESSSAQALKEHSAALTDMEHKLQLSESSSAQALKEHSAALTDMEHKLQLSESNRSQMSGAFEEEKRLRIELEKDLSELRESSGEAALHSLLAKEKKEKDEKIAELKRELRKLEGYRFSLATAEAKAEACESNLIASEQRVATAQAEIDQLKRRTLSPQKTESGEVIQTLRRRAVNAEARTASLTEELNEMREMNARESQELVSRVEAAAQEEIDALKKELTVFIEKNKQSSPATPRKTVAVEAPPTPGALLAAASREARWEEERKQFELEIEELADEVTMLRARDVDTQTQIGALEASVDRVKRESNQIIAEHKRMSEDSQSERARAIAKAEELGEELTQVQNALSLQETRMQETSVRLEVSQDEALKAKSEARAQISRVRAEMDDQWRQLNEAMRVERLAKSDAEERASQLRRRVAVLQGRCNDEDAPVAVAPPVPAPVVVEHEEKTTVQAEASEATDVTEAEEDAVESDVGRVSLELEKNVSPEDAIYLLRAALARSRRACVQAEIEAKDAHERVLVAERAAFEAEQAKCRVSEILVTERVQWEAQSSKAAAQSAAVLREAVNEASASASEQTKLESEAEMTRRLNESDRIARAATAGESIAKSAMARMSDELAYLRRDLQDAERKAERAETEAWDERRRAASARADAGAAIAKAARQEAATALVMEESKKASELHQEEVSAARVAALEAQVTVEELQRGLESAQQQECVAMAAVDTVTKQCVALEEALARQRNELEEAYVQMRELNAKTINPPDDGSAQAAEREVKLNARVREALAEAHDLKQKAEQASAQWNIERLRLETEVGEAKAEVGRLEKEKTETVERLSDQCLVQNEANSQLQRKISVLERDVSHSEQRLVEATRQLEQNQTDAKKWQEMYDQVRSEKDELLTSIERIQAESLSEAKRAQDEERIAKADLARCEREAQSAREILQKERGDAEQRLEAMRADVERVVKAEASLEHAETTRELEASLERLNRAEQDLIEWKRLAEDRACELVKQQEASRAASAQERMLAVDRELALHEQELRVATESGTLAAVKDELAQAKGALQGRAQEIASLQSALHSAQEEAVSMQRTARLAVGSEARLKEQGEAAQRASMIEIDRLYARLEDATTQLEDAEMRIKASQKEVEEAKAAELAVASSATAQKEQEAMVATQRAVQDAKEAELRRGRERKRELETANVHAKEVAALKRAVEAEAKTEELRKQLVDALDEQRQTMSKLRAAEMVLTSTKVAAEASLSSAQQEASRAISTADEYAKMVEEYQSRLEEEERRRKDAALEASKLTESVSIAGRESELLAASKVLVASKLASEEQTKVASLKSERQSLRLQLGRFHRLSRLKEDEYEMELEATRTDLGQLTLAVRGLLDRLPEGMKEQKVPKEEDGWWTMADCESLVALIEFSSARADAAVDMVSDGKKGAVKVKQKDETKDVRKLMRHIRRALKLVSESRAQTAVFLKENGLPERIEDGVERECALRLVEVDEQTALMAQLLASGHQEMRRELDLFEDMVKGREELAKAIGLKKKLMDKVATLEANQSRLKDDLRSSKRNAAELSKENVAAVQRLASRRDSTSEASTPRVSADEEEDEEKRKEDEVVEMVRRLRERFAGKGIALPLYQLEGSLFSYRGGKKLRLASGRGGEVMVKDGGMWVPLLERLEQL